MIKLNSMKISPVENTINKLSKKSEKHYIVIRYILKNIMPSNMFMADLDKMCMATNVDIKIIEEIMDTLEEAGVKRYTYEFYKFPDNFTAPKDI